MTQISEEQLKKKREELEGLYRQYDEIKLKIARATGQLIEHDETPKGFDYKDAVLTVFMDTTSPLDIDDVHKQVSIKHSFKADRKAVANRLNYLTDRDKKLERVPNKRGFYQLRKNIKNIAAEEKTSE